MTIGDINLDANNQTDSSDVFYKRILYYFYAYSLGQGPRVAPKGVQDYWKFERLFYGKVDPDFNVVEANVGFLSQVAVAKGNILLMDDAAEAFKVFKSYFTLPLRLGKIENGTPISSPIAYRGYDDPLERYEQHAMNLVRSFNDDLFNSQKYYYILNQKDYMRAFFKFYFSKKVLLTKSAFYMSTLCSPLSSGLTVDIADLNPANDQEKFDFISLPNFEFYRQAAINAGFLIDKNIPWRLHFDLKSPVNIKKYGGAPIGNLSYVKDFFSFKFSPAHRDDITLIQRLLGRGYSDFFNQLPSSSHDHGAPDQKREKPPNSDAPPVFTPTYWIEQYANVKNAENGHPFVEQDLQRLKANAKNLTSRSQFLALDYVYQKFKMPWISPNSLFYEKLRREFKEKGDFSLDKFSEYVKMVVMNSISSMY